MTFFSYLRAMKHVVKEGMEAFIPFVESLPQLFEAGEGELLFKGRNTIRAFEVAGESVAVKQFRAPSGINALLYGRLRKSKAQRAFENALRLEALAISTPEPIAWAECYRGGRLQCSFLVTRRSSYHDFKLVTEAFPAPHTLPILDGFAAFTAKLHEQGVMHGDFNNSNTQWLEEADGTIRFELIDINRMQFKGRPLTRGERLHNLRRLTCQLTAYTYILRSYGRLVGWHERYSQIDAAEGLIRFIRKRDRKRNVKRWLKGGEKK